MTGKLRRGVEVGVRAGKVELRVASSPRLLRPDEARRLAARLVKVANALETKSCWPNPNADGDDLPERDEHCGDS